MNMQGAKPLFEDASASNELRSFVTMARGDGPSQADLDRLAARLSPVVGLSAGVLATSAAVVGSAPLGVTSAPGIAAAKVGTLGKLLATGTGKLLAVGLSLGIGAGLWGLTGGQPAAKRQVSAPVVAVQPQPVEAAPVVERTAEPVVAPPVLKTARPTAAARTHVRTSKPSAAEPAIAASEPAPSELSLIQQAESARGNSGEALAILLRHERLYPRGALAQEREVLAVEMLIKAGKTDQARARAQRFEAQHPGSAHVPRLRTLLERAAAE
jgi:hypothetical protein